MDGRLKKQGPRRFCGTFASTLFILGGVKQKKSPPRLPYAAQRVLLDQVSVVRVTAPDERRRFQQLLKQHHYLGSLKAVVEQMYYADVDAQSRWVTLLLFSVAARHLCGTAISGLVGRAPNVTAA